MPLDDETRPELHSELHPDGLARLNKVRELNKHFPSFDPEPPRREPEPIDPWTLHDPATGEPLGDGADARNGSGEGEGPAGAGTRTSGAERGADDAPEPIPILPPLPEPQPYPVDALGDVLAPASRAIAERAQCDPAIAAHAVLAAASLAAQPRADVEGPHGERKPLSLYLVTIAESGERKSTADGLALAPVREHEDSQRDGFGEKWSVYRDAHDAWTAQRSRIKADKKTDMDAKRVALEALGPEPKPPLSPRLLVGEPTIEGLFKTWKDSPPSLGLFNAEAGAFLGGHAMSRDHRLAAAASLSSLWDGAPVDRLRAGDGALKLYGRRLAAHLMMQPTVAPELYADDRLRGQGILNRILAVAPPSLAGTRTFRRGSPDRSGPLAAYDDTIGELLSRPWPLRDGTRNELEPPTLMLAPDAEPLWIAYFNATETRLGEDGALASIRGFGARLGEHVLRLAGVIALTSDPDAATIGAVAIEGAAALADYYAGEALRLWGDVGVAPELRDAERLRVWLLGSWSARCETHVSPQEVMRLGPNPLRGKAAAEAAIALLIEHGWLVPDGPNEVDGKRRRETFRIVRGDT